MTFDETVRVRNNVTIRGLETGPTIVFAHGFGCDQNMWRFVAPAYERTHRLVLFDYVGCGRSDWSAFNAARYASLDGYARDVLDVCEAADVHDAIFVGHSVSGVIGLLAAVREPARFSKLVMLAPSPRYVNDPPYTGGFERRDLEELLSLMDHNYIGWASHLAPIVMGNPEGTPLTDELRDSFCSTDPVASKAFARATFFADNRGDLAKAPVPSLIVQVRHDAIAPVEVGQYMRVHMPESELVIIDAAGHCPHMSHPDLTLQAMHRFIQGSPPVT
ncbi:MAG TPA: alpha/beta hydrolase [Burkholderiales bacterium]|nr:alpha/beta hydrolase [Burkholderiales bacterium]